jgi:prepilin-type N-terminal cleavage/methylation domain-containing protein
VRGAGAGRRRRGDAGLTLIELLVTIVVASLVASSTFVFFAGQQRIYETQTKLLNVQQNLWMALEVMSRQLRASGSGMAGCTTGTVPPVGTTTPPTGLRAWYSGATLRIPPIHINNGAAGAPDQVTFSFFTNASGNYVDGQLSTTVPIGYSGSNINTTSSAPFRAGEFIMLFDTRASPPGGDRGCTLYQITGIAGGSDLVIVNPSSPWNASGAAPALFPAYDYLPANTGIRNLGTLNSIRYFIAPGGADFPPRLMVDDFADANPAQVLAEGIEDMQVAYACDLLPAGNPDGTLTEGTTGAARLVDEWTYNVAGDVPPPTCGIPTAIRVTLFGRSLTPDQNLFGTSGTGTASASFKAAMEDGVAGAPDLFRHRTLTTTIYPRN